jgi:hypothetical protein
MERPLELTIASRMPKDSGQHDSNYNYYRQKYPGLKGSAGHDHTPAYPGNIDSIVIVTKITL